MLACLYMEHPRGARSGFVAKIRRMNVAAVSRVALSCSSENAAAAQGSEFVTAPNLRKNRSSYNIFRNPRSV